MNASPYDAAASPMPPRAGGGPAAPSSPGTSPGVRSGRRPEDTVMPEHAPSSDSTVRMDTGRPSGRPPATGQGPQVAPPSQPGPPAADPTREVDDTRPVPRDWMTDDGGAPATEGEAAPVAATVLTADPLDAEFDAEFDDPSGAEPWGEDEWIPATR